MLIDMYRSNDYILSHELTCFGHLLLYFISYCSKMSHLLKVVDVRNKTKSKSEDEEKIDEYIYSYFWMH